MRKLALRVGHGLEAVVDRMRRGFKHHVGARDPLTIAAYRGFGHDGRVWLRARVLEERGLEKPAADDGIFRNALHMLRRYESDEIAGARVRVRLGARTWEVETDDEGFVHLDLDLGQDLPAPRDAAERWRELTLELLSPLRPGQGAVLVTGWAVTPPTSARLGVISDVDDTIVHTGANSLLKHWRTVMTTNAHSREPFRGLAAFYRALERGAGDDGCPIFYVSSSPWNVYDLFEQYLEVHDIPYGPFFLKDFGLDEDQWFKGSHDAHKRRAIERLLGCYPALSFILVGDSGQRDAEIYRDIVRAHPGRIGAVYIRDVSDATRDRRTRELLDEVRAAGPQTAYGADLLEAAENARAQGWITAAALEEVRGDIAG